MTLVDRLRLLALATVLCAAVLVRFARWFLAVKGT